MAEINFILGRTLADRRAALDHFSVPKDLLGRSKLLSLRPTHRSVRLHQENAARQGEFLPRQWVLDDFLAEVARRRLNGKAVLSGSALALQLAIRAENSVLPGPIEGALQAPELGRHLAKIFSQTEENFRVSPNFPQWIADLFTQFRTELSDDGDWTSLGQALKSAAHGLSFHDQQCTDLFQGFDAVWLEEPQSLSPARERLLIEIVNLWHRSGVDVFVSFASPISLDGQALLEFFTNEEGSHLGLSNRSYDASAVFRRSSFEQWVGQGSSQFFWSENGYLTELDPGLPQAVSSPPCLADRLYQQAPGPVDSALIAAAAGSVYLSNPPSLFQECLDIAKQIKIGWLSGRWALQDVAVAVPDLPAYAPTLIQVFRDHGLPLDLSSGKHLIRSPIGSLLASLLRISGPRHSPQDFLDLVATAPALPTMPMAVGPLLKHLQQAKVRGVRPRQWKQDMAAWSESAMGPVQTKGLLASLDILDDLYEGVVAPLKRAETSLSFLEVLEESLKALGFPDSLLQEEFGSQAQAWRSLLELVQVCQRDFISLNNQQKDKTWAVSALTQGLSQASFRSEPPNPAAVSVLGCLELRGLAPKHLWLAGLHRGAFPALRGPNPLLPPTVWSQLQWVNPMGEARSLLASCLREALLQAEFSLFLSWPQRKKGREQNPAPPMEDFIALCGTLPLILTPDSPEYPGLRRSQFVSRGELPLNSPAHLDVLMRAQGTRCDSRASQPLGPFDGRLSGPFEPTDTAVSVTRLERFVKCPARDWYKRGLGLGEIDERTEDASALTVGTLLHNVLEDFVRQNMAAYRQSNPSFDDLATRLADVAKKALDDPKIQPSMSEDARQGLRDKWLPGLQDDRPRGLLAAWLALELSRAPFRTPMRVELDLKEFSLGERALKGRMDRVDSVGTTGFLVVDYKTGSPPSSSNLEQGLALQGFLYTEAAKSEWPNRTQSASVYSQISQADGIKDSAWMGDPDLVKSLVSRAKTVVMDAERRAKLLAHTEHAVRSISKGVHHPTLAHPKDAGCEYCDFRTICRVSPDHASRLSQSADSCGPLVSE